MPRNTKDPVQQYNGSTEKHKTYVGPVAELTVDTTKATVVVHDGRTKGGHPMAKEERKLIGSKHILINGGDSNTLATDSTMTVDSKALSLDIISNDTDNQLNVGDDGLLYVPENDIKMCVVDADPLLYLSEQGCVASSIGLDYNTTTGRLDIKGAMSNEVVASVTVPSSTSALKDVTLETDPEGQEEGTYLHFVYLLADNSTKDTYVDVTTLNAINGAGNGIVINDKVVSAAITEGGGLVFNRSTGNLEVDFIYDYGTMD